MAKLNITILPLKLPLYGTKGIDVLVDGAVAATADFGQTMTIELVPGARNIALLLRGVLERKSKALTVHAIDGSQISVTAKYSRLWGNLKLRLA